MGTHFRLRLLPLYVPRPRCQSGTTMRYFPEPHPPLIVPGGISRQHPILIPPFPSAPHTVRRHHGQQTSAHRTCTFRAIVLFILGEEPTQNTSGMENVTTRRPSCGPHRGICADWALGVVIAEVLGGDDFPGGWLLVDHVCC